MAHRLGVDVGGTFTDLVGIDAASGAIRSRKVLTTPDAPARGVLYGLHALGADAAAIVATTVTLVTLVALVLVARIPASLQSRRRAVVLTDPAAAGGNEAPVPAK